VGTGVSLRFVECVVDCWNHGEEPGEDGQDPVCRDAGPCVLFPAGEGVHWVVLGYCRRDELREDRGKYEQRRESSCVSV